MSKNGVRRPAESRGRLGFAHLAAAAPLFVALGACETFPDMGVQSVRKSDQARPPSSSTVGERQAARRTLIERIGAPPLTSASAGGSVIDNGPETPAQISRLFDEDTVRATLPPQPIPQFIDTVFNDILKVPYSLGPGVAEMRQIVALRGAVEVDERTFFAMIEMALRDYGVSVIIENGVVRLSRSEQLIAGAPLIVRSRTAPEVPDASRAVIQFFELQSIEASALQGLLAETFPDMGGVKITVRQDINTLMLVGRAREVATAAQIISDVDQPRMAGAQIARIEPVYWPADKLAQSVSQTLQTEGYQTMAATTPGLSRAVTFMPVPYTNQLLVFSNIPAAFERAIFWIRELDRPAALGDQVGTFVYQVRNMSAEELGRIAASVSGETASIISAVNTAQNAGGGAMRNAAVPGDPTQQQQQQRTPTPAAPQTSSVVPGARITVDAGSNRIIYKGTPIEFEQARQLFEQIDTPALQVIIEVTIAEVTLSDETRFGLEWFAQEALNVGLISGGTEGGLGLSAGGLTIDYDHGTVRAALNAFASNNNINVLSSPRIVARSGGEARIQVGTDVPIITSQRAADNQTAGDTDILQTVQYRQTGVIMGVKPVVFGDRVQIDVFQEVSSQANNANTAIASPLILNRSIETALTVKEGSTAVIGGLMQDNYTRGNTGIPILKDIPFIGAAFRTDTVNGDKTELLMLVTPHIVRTGDELADAADYYADSINELFARRGPHAYTLLPWRGFWGGPRPTAGGVLPADVLRSEAETLPPAANRVEPAPAPVAPAPALVSPSAPGENPPAAPAP